MSLHAARIGSENRVASLRMQTEIDRREAVQWLWLICVVELFGGTIRCILAGGVEFPEYFASTLRVDEVDVEDRRFLRIPADWRVPVALENSPGLFWRRFCAGVESQVASN